MCENTQSAKHNDKDFHLFKDSGKHYISLKEKAISLTDFCLSTIILPKLRKSFTGSPINKMRQSNRPISSSAFSFIRLKAKTFFPKSLIEAPI